MSYPRESGYMSYPRQGGYMSYPRQNGNFFGASEAGNSGIPEIQIFPKVSYWCFLLHFSYNFPNTQFSANPLTLSKVKTWWRVEASNARKSCNRPPFLRAKSAINPPSLRGKRKVNIPLEGSWEYSLSDPTKDKSNILILSFKRKYSLYTNPAQ